MGVSPPPPSNAELLKEGRSGGGGKEEEGKEGPTVDSEEQICPEVLKWGGRGGSL